MVQGKLYILKALPPQTIKTPTACFVWFVWSKDCTSKCFTWDQVYTTIYRVQQLGCWVRLLRCWILVEWGRILVNIAKHRLIWGILKPLRKILSGWTKAMHVQVFCLLWNDYKAMWPLGLQAGFNLNFVILCIRYIACLRDQRPVALYKFQMRLILDLTIDF